MITQNQNKKKKTVKLCCIDTESFIAYIKTDDIYKDIKEDLEARFDISNYELDRPLHKESNKKVKKWIRLKHYQRIFWTERKNL